MPQSQEHKTTKGGVVVSTTLFLPAVKSRCTITWQVRRADEVEMSLDLQACPGSTPDIPRIGMVWPLPAAMRDVSWYGRGPTETYPDRMAAGGLGLWKSSVDAWVHSYHRPQENGNRSDVRWMRIGAKGGASLRIEALDSMLAVNAWPWTQDDLENTGSPWKLPHRNTVTMHIDHRQMGLGADNTWGAKPYPPYTLSAGKRYTYSYRVSLMEPGH